MQNAATATVHALADFGWLELLRSFGPYAAAFVGWLALKNWKRQDKAKREADFLDALIEATHAFIIAMSRPVALHQAVRTGMICHGPSPFDPEKLTIAGAIEYIQKASEATSRRLDEALAQAQPLVVRLRSLASKGQIFGFKDYGNCYQSIQMLTWQFDRVAALGSIISIPTLNWENPHVLGTLEKVIAAESDEIQKLLNKHDIEIIGFSQATYKCLYA